MINRSNVYPLWGVSRTLLRGPGGRLKKLNRATRGPPPQSDRDLLSQKPICKMLKAPVN
jgi:hypothetical protein